MVIAASLEVEHGVENLWKQGRSSGFKPFPNYGQYIPANYFKAFMSGFPFLWADRKYWYRAKDDIPWDMFLPFVHHYNESRRQLLKVTYLMLDESMSAWCPKTTKTGGLPNITFEPRKPVELGTMIRNGVDCISGIFVHHDVVQEAAAQSDKKYVGEKSHMPKKEPIPVHIAEVLRQCEGSGLIRGGWVGGDAWFGLVATCVELRKRKEIFSTFIVKQNVGYFPKSVLHSILLARYPKRPAGHWAVMKATISGVDIFIMAYAWSQKGIAYMVSSCGKTVRHETPYRTKFDDGFGNVDYRELPRPAVAHFLYEFLPLIDEHNKTCQNALALEKCWLTKDPLLQSDLGTVVVLRCSS